MWDAIGLDSNSFPADAYSETTIKTSVINIGIMTIHVFFQKFLKIRTHALSMEMHIVWSK